MATLRHLDSEAREEWNDLNDNLEPYLEYCRRCTFVKTIPLPYPQWKLTLPDGTDKELE